MLLINSNNTIFSLLRWYGAYRHHSQYIFILNLTPGFNSLANDNCKSRREKVKFWIWCALYGRFDGSQIISTPSNHIFIWSKIIEYFFDWKNPWCKVLCYIRTATRTQCSGVIKVFIIHQGKRKRHLITPKHAWVQMPSFYPLVKIFKVSWVELN